MRLAFRLRNLVLRREDRPIIERPEILELFRVDLPEAYRQDGIGSAYDATIPASWPIPLDEIGTTVHLWHAEHDPLVGNMTRELAGHLPDARLTELPGAGHVLGYRRDAMDRDDSGGPVRLVRPRHRVWSALLAFGASILLGRTIVMLAQDAAAVLVPWVLGLLVIEMVIDVTALAGAVFWWKHGTLPTTRLALRAGAAAALVHAGGY